MTKKLLTRVTDPSGRYLTVTGQNQAMGVTAVSYPSVT